MKKILLITTMLLLGMLSANAGDLQNFSWSSTSNVPGAIATYTISYQLETPSPDAIIYALNTGNWGIWNSVNSVTINGSPVLYTEYIIISGKGLFIVLTDPTLATAGANIAISVEATNSLIPDSYDWNFIHTSGLGGNAIDSASNIMPIIIAPTLSIEEFDYTNISLFPNPAKDQLTIELNQGATLKKVNIYSSLGQNVGSSTMEVVDISNLSTGLYFIEIETNKGITTKRLLVRD